MAGGNDTSSAPAVVRVLAHSTGPPRSNVCTFQVHCQPSVLFCAYALDGGTIVVQQVRVFVSGEGRGVVLPAYAPRAPARARARNTAPV